MIYPYDPTTGKRLMRAGFHVNPISPMTQKEVDLQCDAVSQAALADEINAEINNIHYETPKYCYVPGFRPD